MFFFFFNQAAVNQLQIPGMPYVNNRSYGYFILYNFLQSGAGSHGWSFSIQGLEPCWWQPAFPQAFLPAWSANPSQRFRISAMRGRALFLPVAFLSPQTKQNPPHAPEWLFSFFLLFFSELWFFCQLQGRAHPPSWAPCSWTWCRKSSSKPGTSKAYNFTKTNIIQNSTTNSTTFLQHTIMRNFDFFCCKNETDNRDRVHMGQDQTKYF